MATNMSEAIVGIETYVDPSIPGFSAVIKQRYSDFIVNEVGQDNEVVQLTDFEIPEPPPEGVAMREQAMQAKEEKDLVNREMTDETKLAELAPLLDNDAETMAQIKKMLDSYGNDLEFVNLKPQEDKAKRTAIHKLIKERFSGRMVSETAEGTMRLRMHRKKDDHDNRGKPKSNVWNELGGEFCRFCLFKENRETMEALNHIISNLRVPNKVFSIAGTKDRRGVTSQWITAHKVKAERLLGLNKNLRNMQLGNFSYVTKGLKLGDLNGNRFTITLRDVKVESEEILNRSMSSLRDKGFINYFGMQRFGTGSVGTHHIGRAILRSEWQAAVDLIMKPRAGESEDAEKARRHWDENRNAAEALKMFPKRWVAESQILWSFKKAGHQRSPFEALGNIPRNLRLMYIHAYQSYIWNCMVSERLRLYGSDKAVVGDLVAEDRVAEERTGGEAEDKDEFSKAKVLTEENVGQYTIYDVVLPMPGFDVLYPAHALKEKYKELMAKDGLDPDNMRRSHKEYSLPGSYRAFMSKPENVEWEIMRYDDQDIPLTLTDLDVLNGKSQPTAVEGGKYLALILHLTLKSSQYATMAIREVCKQDTSAAFQSSLNATESAPAAAAPNAAPAVATGSNGGDQEMESPGPAKRNIDQVEGAAETPEPKAQQTEN